jgi:hypothetical protein
VPAGSLVAGKDLEQAIHHGLLILPKLGAPLVPVRTLHELRPVRAAAAATSATPATEFCGKFDAAAAPCAPPGC